MKTFSFEYLSSLTEQLLGIMARKRQEKQVSRVWMTLLKILHHKKEAPN